MLDTQTMLDVQTQLGISTQGEEGTGNTRTGLLVLVRAGQDKTHTHTRLALTYVILY